MSNSIRKLTMEDLTEGNLDGITMEELYYNGFSGQFKTVSRSPDKSKLPVLVTALPMAMASITGPRRITL